MYLTSLKKRPIFNTLSLAMFLFCTAFVIYKSTECFTKFLKRPQSNEVSIEHASKHPYPTITICPVNKDFLETLCNIADAEYKYNAKWFGTEGNQTICSDPEKLFDAMASGPEDTVDSLYQVNFKHNSVIVLDWRSPTSSWKNAFHFIDSYEYGNYRCFSYEPPDSAFIIALWFKRNVSIHIHNKGDFTATSNTKYFLLKIGQSFNIDIGYEYLQMLEFDGVDCRNYFDEQRDSCIDAYIYEESMKRFGCITPYHKVKSNICTNQTLGRQANTLWKLENRNNTERACPLSCKYISTRLGRTSEQYDANSKTASLYLSFEQFIKVSRSHISYGGLELLAEVGGYVGLFLGVSIVQVIGLLEIFYNKFKHLVSKILKRM